MTTSEKEMIIESNAYNYVRNHPDEISKYPGKWMLIYKNKIVSAGEDLIKIHKEFQKDNPNVYPFILKLPEHPVMLL